MWYFLVSFTIVLIHRFKFHVMVLALVMNMKLENFCFVLRLRCSNLDITYILLSVNIGLHINSFRSLSKTFCPLMCYYSSMTENYCSFKKRRNHQVKVKIIFYVLCVEWSSIVKYKESLIANILQKHINFISSLEI